MNTNQIETVVSEIVETPAAPVKLVRTKKTGPAREGRQVVTVEVKVEAETLVAEEKTETPPPAPTTTKYKCSMTGKSAEATELRCPPLGVLKTKLGKDLLTEEDLIANATLPRFTRWSDEEHSLSNRLAMIRGAKSRFDANEARKEAFRSFAYDLQRGQVVEYDGVDHMKCAQGRCMWVAPVTAFRFPDVGIMVQFNPLMVKQLDESGEVKLNEHGKPTYVAKRDRNGDVICIVPTVQHALRKFACCPRCAESENLDEGNSIDYETTLVVVAKAKEEADAEFAARKAKWERLNRARNGGATGNGGQQMSRQDEEAGLQEFRSGKFNPDRDRGNKGRGRQERTRDLDADDLSADDLIEEFRRG